MGFMKRDQPSTTPNALRRQRSGSADPWQMMRDLMSWDPFREMGPSLARSMEERSFLPAFDVRETTDAYVFQADLPGFREEDIEISMTGNRLTVSGRREAEQTDDNDKYYCVERSYGSFTRTFTLPEGVDPDQVEAQLREGILELRVTKSEEAQPRKISLRGSSSRGELAGDSSQRESRSDAAVRR